MNGKHHIRLGKYRVPLPGSAALRIARRLRRKVEVWWGKRKERKAARTRARLKEK